MDCEEVLLNGLIFKSNSYPEAVNEEQFKSVIELSIESQKKKIMMHCRPKADFHLGNIWMLNKLKQFLDFDFDVYIVIIMFDEDIELGSSLYIKLLEMVLITKNFLQTFFENHRNLHVLTSIDLEISQTLLDEYHNKWKELVTTTHVEDRNLPQYMIDVLTRQQGRYWASTQHTFVAKCLLFYDLIKPNFVICGEKHRHISVSFKILSQELSKVYPEIIYLEDLLDLSGKMAMDSTNSGIKLMNITDSEHKVMHNISLIDTDFLNDWSNSIFEKVVLAGGNFDILGKKTFTLKDFRSLLSLTDDLFKGIFIQYLFETLKKLNNILKEINSNQSEIIEYSLPPEYLGRWRSDSISNIKIRWSPKIRWTSMAVQSVVEKVIKSFFTYGETNEIYVRREFGYGKSGARVFELIVFDNKGQNIIDSRIIKIGKYNQLNKEKRSYDLYISRGRTFAFVEAVAISTEIDGLSGLLYADAKRWLGIGIGETLFSLFDIIMSEIKSDTTRINELINKTFKHLGNLLYENGQYYHFRPYRDFYNSILPPNLWFTASTLIGNTLISEELKDQFENLKTETITPHEVFEISGQQEWETSKYYQIKNLRIIELEENRVRLTEDDWNVKIDVFLEDITIYHSIKNLKLTYLNIWGRIKNTRQRYLIDLSQTIAGVSTGELLQLVKCEDPLLDLNDHLDSEIAYLRLSVIHGDLNLQNILTSGSNVAIIDYALTGPNKPTAFDFIKLEVDLRINILPCLLTLDDYLEIDEFLIEGKSKPQNIISRNAIDIILNIRETACHYLRLPESENYDFKDYYAGVYFYTLSMLKYKDMSESSKKFIYITSAIYSRVLADR